MVQGLVFMTSAGQEWHSGEQQPPTDTWPDKPTNDVLIGFSGYCSGDGVEGIRPVVVSFEPVQWAKPKPKPTP